jgi:hypothetical protein
MIDPGPTILSIGESWIYSRERFQPVGTLYPRPEIRSQPGGDVPPAAGDGRRRVRFERGVFEDNRIVYSVIW